MTHKERFYNTVERKPVDRPATWLGMPVPDACKGLYEYFRVEDMDGLKRRIDDDIYPVDVPFNCPPANHIACAFDFAKKSGNADYEERTLTAPGFFEDYSDPSAVELFDWPVPEHHMSTEECRNAVDRIPDDYAVQGIMWSAHFQDACSAFGMETALVKMISEPEIFQAVIGRITDFYLKANEFFYQATEGKLDAVLIGNDFGSQTGLILSPELIRKYVWPGTSKLIDQAKSFGLKVIHHSCGAVYDIIPDLIDMGVDVIHPIQALAVGMEPERLQHDFANSVSFCGGVDAQELLVNGNPEQIRDKVHQLQKLFPTGLIISPSHEAVLPDIHPQNIEALFDTVNR